MDLNRLALLLQRLLDAELLNDTDGEKLLSETDAARQSLEAGDWEMARSHLEQVALFTDMLTKTGALALADGHAVIQTANDLLDSPDTGDPPS